jgi:hypothetical protein
MTSTCTIRRKTGATALVNGFKVAVWDDVHADEPVRFVGGSSRRIEIAGVGYEEASGRCDFRYDLTDLADGDFIDITAGEWAGTVLRVLDATKGDQRTARRVPVTEAERPAEWP